MTSGPRPTMTYPWTPSTDPARPAQPDGNLIYNPSFEWDASNEYVKANPTATTLAGVSNSSFWTVYQANQGEQFTLSNDAAAGHSLKVDITQPGSVNYAVQVRQDGLNVVQQKRYQVDFDAWASAPRHMMVKVGGGDTRGFAAYSGEQDVALTTTASQHHSFTFDMAATTDTAARLEFNLGAAGAGQVWIDNVSLKQIGDAPVVQVRPPLPDGNLIYNPSFTQNDPAVPGIAGVAGTSYWSTWEDGSSGLTSTVKNGELQLAVAHVNPANNWHVQLNQTGVPLEQGKSYTLTFKGHSTSPRTVAVVIGENGGSYARYLDKTAALTTTGQTYTYTFTSPVTNPAAQLQILGAVGQQGDAYTLAFTDFKLVKTAP
ncbi:carbohydrate binding domain-containing protein [Deinococcus sonorensis]|uniref:Carbohydrate binding domain-containing protein n=1 Tax=Deinococcus sonorensis KR-87 TaxID=694439 RepID=A0AAU7UBM4_9DEIO